MEAGKSDFHSESELRDSFRPKSFKPIYLNGVMAGLVECEPLDLVGPGSNATWLWMFGFIFVLFRYCRVFTWWALCVIHSSLVN